VIQRAPAKVKPVPDETSFPAVSSLPAGKWGDWSARPRTDDGKPVPGEELLQELVIPAGADVIDDVWSDRGVVQRAPDGDHPAVGLNYTDQTAGSEDARTVFLDDHGVATPYVPLDGGRVRVAIVVRPGALAHDRAYAFEALRHELRHAAHFQLTIALLERWRAAAHPKTESRAAFTAWLEKQPIAPVDRELAEERVGQDTQRRNPRTDQWEPAVDAPTDKTEVLAHVEGMLAGLPFLVEPASLDTLVHGWPAAIKQLEGVGWAPNLGAHFWKHAGSDIQQLALKRIQTYCCTVLSADRLATFSSWLDFLHDRSGLAPTDEKPTDQPGAERWYREREIYQVYHEIRDMLDKVRTVVKSCTAGSKAGRH
jgi:hypothetical protein